MQQLSMPSVAGDNEVMDGLRTMSSLITTRRLKVHRSCKAFIDSVPGYSWDPKAAEKGEDAPLKVDDHAIDAGRYGIHTTQAVWRNSLCAPAPIAA